MNTEITTIDAEPDIQVTVTTTIEATMVNSVGRVRLGFATMDVGSTQGSTLSSPDFTVNYLPGTRYESTALEVAQVIVRRALVILAGGNDWTATAREAAVRQAVVWRGCSFWNGTNDWWEDDDR